MEDRLYCIKLISIKYTFEMNGFQNNWNVGKFKYYISYAVLMDGQAEEGGGEQNQN